MKSLHFTGDDVISYEPVCGRLSIAYGSINKIRQLFAASIYIWRTGTRHLVPWVFRYITCGITAVLPSLPKQLLPASAISELYNERCKPVVSLYLDKYIWFYKSSILFCSYVPWKPLYLVIKLFLTNSQLMNAFFYSK